MKRILVLSWRGTLAALIIFWNKVRVDSWRIRKGFLYPYVLPFFLLYGHFSSVNGPKGHHKSISFFCPRKEKEKKKTKQNPLIWIPMFWNLNLYVKRPPLLYVMYYPHVTLQKETGKNEKLNYKAFLRHRETNNNESSLQECCEFYFVSIVKTDWQLPSKWPSLYIIRPCCESWDLVPSRFPPKTSLSFRLRSTWKIWPPLRKMHRR